jgi:glyoxylase-like metal-dependent hydrolase (beta-lactamase superfamily II)
MPIMILAVLLGLGAPPQTASVPARSVPSSPGGAANGGGAGAHAGPSVAGSMDKEIIRKIIRQHTADVQACFEAELDKKPDLFGRIMVQFTIAAPGNVIASALQSSTMGNPRVADCTVKAVRRWEFPKPLGGGIVIVSYPFVFIPGAPIALLAGTKGTGAVACTFFDIDLIVHRSTDGQGRPSNGLIAVTEHGLLLADTPWTDAETEAVLKWGQTRLGKPWLGAIITHDHADRDGGLGALQRRHIPIAALDLTVAKLEKRGVRGVTTLFTAKAGAVQDARGFEAFYPGPGHTSDNIVLKFRQALFAGCLLESVDAPDLGFTGDADLASWPGSVRRVAARYPKVPIIPGHGPIDRAGASYQHTLDLLASSGLHRWGAH